MTIGSLFSGIGGLELGLEWAGLGPVLWQVEKDEFCRLVLAKHWPSSDRSVTDVQQASKDNLAHADVICGGFPCQDISYAGKGAGLDGDRSGLWKQFARVVGELRPRFVVVENVAALLARGADVVCADLARLGYDAVWTTIRASDIGSPQKRERLFIVAYTRRERLQRWANDQSLEGETRPRTAQEIQRQWGGDATCDGGSIGVAYPDRTRGSQQKRSVCEQRGRVGNGGKLEHTESRGRETMLPGIGAFDESEASNRGQAEPGVGRVSDGLPGWMDRWPARPGEAQAEWEAPRTIYKCANRPARLRALGNAVVPQVAFVVGMMIKQIEWSVFDVDLPR